MKFGIHSLLFKETFVEKDLPVLDKCKGLGFDAVEIIPFDPDNFPAQKVKNAASDLGLTINLGYGLPEEFNIISTNPDIRRSGVEFSKKLIDLCNEADAEVFGGVIYCAWGYLSGKMRTEDEWKLGVEGFREISEYALQTSDLILGVEPLNRFESHFINTAGDAVRFIKEVGMSNLRVHLDTFHMIREEDDITQAVLDTGDLVGYIHSCENQRGIPGSGLFPWEEFFMALRQVQYDGCITVESFDPNMENIAKLCCIWRKLADSPEQLASEGLKFLKGIYSKTYNLKNL